MSVLHGRYRLPPPVCGRNTAEEKISFEAESSGPDTAVCRVKLHAPLPRTICVAPSIASDDALRRLVSLRAVCCYLRYLITAPVSLTHAAPRRAAQPEATTMTAALTDSCLPEGCSGVCFARSDPNLSRSKAEQRRLGNPHVPA